MAERLAKGSYLARPSGGLILAILAGAAVAAVPKVPSPAEAACDEQLGEFHREGNQSYCDVNGVVFQTREEVQPRIPSAQRQLIQQGEPKASDRERIVQFTKEERRHR